MVRLWRGRIIWPCGLMMMFCADAGWGFLLVDWCLLGGFYTRAGLGLIAWRELTHCNPLLLQT